MLLSEHVAYYPRMANVDWRKGWTESLKVLAVGEIRTASCLLARQRTWRLLDGVSSITVGLTSRVPWLEVASKIPPPPLHTLFFSPQNPGHFDRYVEQMRALFVAFSATGCCSRGTFPIDAWPRPRGIQSVFIHAHPAEVTRNSILRSPRLGLQKP